MTYNCFKEPVLSCWCQQNYFASVCVDCAGQHIRSEGTHKIFHNSISISNKQIFLSCCEMRKAEISTMKNEVIQTTNWYIEGIQNKLSQFVESVNSMEKELQNIVEVVKRSQTIKRKNHSDKPYEFVAKYLDSPFAMVTDIQAEIQDQKYQYLISFSHFNLPNFKKPDQIPTRTIKESREEQEKISEEFSYVNFEKKIFYKIDLDGQIISQIIDLEDAVSYSQSNYYSIYYGYCDLPDNQYFCSGNYGSYCYILDKKTFACKREILMTTRLNPGQYYYFEGLVYIFGSEKNKLSETYSLSTGYWKTIAPMPTPAGGNSCVVFNGRIAIAACNSDSIVFFSPSVNSYIIRKILI